MEDNRQLARRYFAEVWDPESPANEEALRRFLSPSFKRHMSPLVEPLDLEGQIQRLAGIRDAFPDIRMTVEQVAGEGAFVATRATMRGTHHGELAGIAPTGNTITVSLIDLFRVEDGQFVEQWGGPDMLDLFGQLGATVG